MTYTPTPKELEELGFKREGPSHWWNGPIKYHLEWKWIIVLGNGTPKWQAEEIYPRSKEHLEQIILAFKP